MKTVHCFRFASVLALSLLTGNAVRADAVKSAKTIAPYLDDGTIAVGRVDLTKVDVPEVFKTLAKFVPARPKDIEQSQRSVSRMLKKLREQNVAEAFVVVSLSDLPRSKPFLIIPVGDGGDHQQVAKLLSMDGRRGPFEVCTKLGNVVFCGSAKTLARLKTIKRSARTNLEPAFSAVAGAAVQFAFVPSKDHHRVLTEMMPKLPPQYGGMTGPQISKAVQWAALGIQLPPKLKAELIVSADNAASAKRLKQTVTALVQVVKNIPNIRRAIPGLDKIANLLGPTVKANRLTMTFDAQSEPGKKVIALLGTAVGQARKAASRASSMNNLKQFGLAMHNFHDVYKSFPPHASYSKKGKPMLSWRVYLLPFLEQNELFKQFHLDEPWDSKHNKTLIAKMPKLFADPSGSLKKAGMTRYVAPIGPKNIFDGKPEGNRIRDITDGTSNTIMFIEAAPESAVIWTKPDDLIIDTKNPGKGLIGKDAKGFQATFADGSVRFISKSVKIKTLRALFTRNGGEVVNLP